MAGSVRAVLLLGRQLLRILHLRLLVLRLWRLGWVLLASFSIGYRRLLWWRLISLLVRLVRLLIGLIRLLVGLVRLLIWWLLLLVGHHGCSPKDTRANDAGHDQSYYYTKDGGEQSADQEKDPEVTTGGKEYDNNH